MTAFQFGEDRPGHYGAPIPEFDHGTDLLVLLRSDGAVEFRDENGASIKANTAVNVGDHA